MSLRRITQKCTFLSRNQQYNKLFVRFKKKPVTPEMTEKYLDPEMHSKLSSSTVLLSQQESDLIFITKYSGLGFFLSNSTQLAGPTIFFPRTFLKWKIFGYQDINEKSLSLFGLLTPKLDLLIIGTGSSKRELSKDTVTYLRKNNVSFEVLSTYQAIASFNFQNNDQRWIAAALLPPEGQHSTLTKYVRSIYNDNLDSTDFIYSDEKRLPQIDDSSNNKKINMLQDKKTSDKNKDLPKSSEEDNEDEVKLSETSEDDKEAEVKTDNEVTDTEVKTVKSPLGQGFNYLSQDAYDVSKGPVNKVDKE